MKCLHLPGVPGLFRHTPVLAALLVGLALAGSPAAQATPAPAKHSTQIKKTASHPVGAKTSTRKASHTKSASKAKGKTGAKAGGKACTAPTKANSKHKRGSKRRTPAPCTTGHTSNGGAAALPAAAATNSPEVPTTGLQLPLMLRTTPSLPDNPAALQRRLDSLVTTQGLSAAGAEVSGVRQLAPDIYAFSLRCADAEQCQRLRLAIEAERDWVAGLQLDERRNIPKPPERHSPSTQ